MTTKLIELRKRMDLAAEAHRHHGMTNVANLTAEELVPIDIEAKRLWNAAYDARRAYHDALDAYLKQETTERRS